MAFVKHFLDQTLSIHVCFPSPTKEKLTIHVFLVQLLHVQLERGAPRRYHHKHYFENIPSGQSSAKLPVILSLGHSVTWSLGHLVIWSLGHLVTWSLGHLVIQSLGHSGHSVT